MDSRQRLEAAAALVARGLLAPERLAELVAGRVDLAQADPEAAIADLAATEPALAPAVVELAQRRRQAAIDWQRQAGMAWPAALADLPEPPCGWVRPPVDDELPQLLADWCWSRSLPAGHVARALTDAAVAARRQTLLRDMGGCWELTALDAERLPDDLRQAVTAMRRAVVAVTPTSGAAADDPAIEPSTGLDAATDGGAAAGRQAEAPAADGSEGAAAADGPGDLAAFWRACCEQVTAVAVDESARWAALVSLLCWPTALVAGWLQDLDLDEKLARRAVLLCQARFGPVAEQWLGWRTWFARVASDEQGERARQRRLLRAWLLGGAALPDATRLAVAEAVRGWSPPVRPETFAQRWAAQLPTSVWRQLMGLPAEGPALAIDDEPASAAPPESAGDPVAAPASLAGAAEVHDLSLTDEVGAAPPSAIDSPTAAAAESATAACSAPAGAEQAGPTAVALGADPSRSPAGQTADADQPPPPTSAGDDAQREGRVGPLVRRLIDQHWLPLLGGLLILVGSSLLAAWAWQQEHWAWRYSVLPALAAGLTLALGEVGQRLCQRVGAVGRSGWVLLGLGVALVPANGLVPALLLVDESVAARAVLGPAAALLSVAFWAWVLRRWCGPPLWWALVAGVAALWLAPAAVALAAGGDAGELATTGARVPPAWLMPVAAWQALGLHLAAAAAVLAVLRLSRRWREQTLVGRSDGGLDQGNVAPRVGDGSGSSPASLPGGAGLLATSGPEQAWFAGLSLAAVLLQALLWTHAQFGSWPVVGQYGLVAVALGWLVLRLERPVLAVDGPSAPSFLGYALIALGVLASLAEPGWRPLVLAAAAGAWLEDARQRRVAVGLAVALLLASGAGLAAALAPCWPDLARPLALALVPLALVLVGRSPWCRWQPTVVGWSVAISALAAALAVMVHHWHGFALGGVGLSRVSGVAVLLVAAELLVLACRRGREQWTLLAAALATLALPYLGCIDFGRGWHGNHLVAGLTVLAVVWALLGRLPGAALIGRSRASVASLLAGLAFVALLVRVVFESGRPAELSGWHQLLDHGGTLGMALVAGLAAWWSRSLLPAILAAVLLVVLLPELKARYADTLDRLGWGSGLGGTLSALLLVGLAHLLQPWRRLRCLSAGDRLPGGRRFPWTCHDQRLLTWPLLGAAWFLLLRFSGPTLMQRFDGLAMACPPRTVLALLLALPAWLGLVAYRGAWGPPGRGVATRPWLGDRWWRRLASVGAALSLVLLVVSAGALPDAAPSAVERIAAGVLVLAGAAAGLRWWGRRPWLAALAARWARFARVGAWLLLVVCAVALVTVGVAPRPLALPVLAVFGLLWPEGGRPRRWLAGILAVGLVWLWTASLGVRGWTAVGREPHWWRWAELPVTTLLVASGGWLLPQLAAWLVGGRWPSYRLALWRLWRPVVVWLGLVQILLGSWLIDRWPDELAVAGWLALSLVVQGLLLACWPWLLAGVVVGCLALIGIEATGWAACLEPAAWGLLAAATMLAGEAGRQLGAGLARRWPHLRPDWQPVAAAGDDRWASAVALAGTTVGLTCLWVLPALRQTPADLPGIASLLVAPLGLLLVPQRPWRLAAAGVLGASLTSLAVLTVELTAGDRLRQLGLEDGHVWALGLAACVLLAAGVGRWASRLRPALRLANLVWAAAILLLLVGTYLAHPDLSRLGVWRLLTSAGLALIAGRALRHLGRGRISDEPLWQRCGTLGWHLAVALAVACVALVPPWLRTPATALIALTMPVVWFAWRAEVGPRRAEYRESAAWLGGLLVVLALLRPAFTLLLFPGRLGDIEAAPHHHANAPVLVLLGLLLLRLRGAGGLAPLTLLAGLAALWGSYFALTALPGLSPFDAPVAAGWVAVGLAQAWILLITRPSPLAAALLRWSRADAGSWQAMRQQWGWLLVGLSHLAAAWILWQCPPAERVGLSLLGLGLASVVIHLGLLRRRDWLCWLACGEVLVAAHLGLWLTGAWPATAAAWWLVAGLGLLPLVDELLGRHPLTAWQWRRRLWQRSVLGLALAGALTLQVVLRPMAAPESLCLLAALLLLAPFWRLDAERPALAWALPLPLVVLAWGLVLRGGVPVSAGAPWAAGGLVVGLLAVAAQWLPRWSDRPLPVATGSARAGVLWLACWSRPPAWLVSLGLSLSTAIAWLAIGLDHVVGRRWTGLELGVLLAATGLPAIGWFVYGQQRRRVRGLVLAELAAVVGLVVGRRWLHQTLPAWQPAWDVWGGLALAVLATAARNWWQAGPRHLRLPMLWTAALLPAATLAGVVLQGLGTDLALLAVAVHAACFTALATEESGERGGPFRTLAVVGFVALAGLAVWRHIEQPFWSAYALPLAVGLLVLVHLHRGHLPPRARNLVRSLALTGLLGAIAAEALIAPTSPLLLFALLLVAGIVTVVAGLLLRLRVYLLAGASGSLIATAGLLLHGLAHLHETVRVSLIGGGILLLGAALLGGTILSQTHRQQLLNLLQSCQRRWHGWE